MRKLSIKQIESGAELAVDIRIHSPHPDTLYKLRLERGTKLTPKHFARLEKTGHEYVFVKDPDTDDLEQYMHDETLDAVEEDLGREMKEIEDNIKAGNLDSIDTKKLRRAIDELVESLKNTKAMLAFTALKSHDDYTSKHSLDVCRLALAFVLANKSTFVEKASSETAASALTIEKYLLEDLGIGALLHDIGKWEIPENILNKPSKLDEAEWEAMKNHPTIGNELLMKLQKQGLIRSPVRMPALTHHEKYGGGGYPNGDRGENIHLYGRLTACCDVYSALTSQRPYRVAMTPNRALQTMDNMHEEENHFDSWIFEHLKDFLHPFPIGQEVVLSDGTSGVVCDLPKSKDKPQVRVLYRGNKRLEETYEISANTSNAPSIVN